MDLRSFQATNWTDTLKVLKSLSFQDLRNNLSMFIKLSPCNIISLSAEGIDPKLTQNKLEVS